MSTALRIILFIASVLTCIYIARKLRNAQIQIIDSIYWISLSILFIILSVFPQIAMKLADVLGFQAPVNFIFLLMIFLLLVRCFLLSIKVSSLEDKLFNVVSEIALKENDKEKPDKE